MCDAIKNIKYKDAAALLEPGDVLLFRGFSFISFLISGLTDSVYTHAAIVDKFRMNETDYCSILQFREFKGGMESSLWREVQKYSGRIDVYRPEKTVSYYRFDEAAGEVKLKIVNFAPTIVLEAMRRVTGLEYGYARIFSFWLRAAPLIRCFSPKHALDWNAKSLKFPVCSTSVAWAFLKAEYHLLHKNQNLTTPGDIAESPRLSYLFTLVKD